MSSGMAPAGTLVGHDGRNRSGIASRSERGLPSLRELPFWGLTLMVLLTTFDNAIGSSISLPQGSRSVVWLIASLTTLLWGLQLLISGGRIRFATVPTALMLAWLLISMISSLDVQNQSRAMAAIMALTEFFLLLLLFQNLAPSRRHLGVLIIAFVLGGVLISLLMLSGATAGVARSGRATIGEAVNPNKLGFILANGCLLGLYLLHIARGRIARGVAGVASAIMLAGLMATGSITAMLALIMAIGVGLLLMYRTRFLRALRALALPALLIGVAVTGAARAGLIPDRALARTTLSILARAPEEQLVPRSVVVRIDYWRVGLTEMMWWSPVFGIGPGQWPVEFSRGAAQAGLSKHGAPDAHSIYLASIVEIGIVGFLVVSTLLVTVLLQVLIWRPDPLAMLGVALVLCIMVSGLTHDVFNNEAFWIILGFVVTAGAVLRREAATAGLPADPTSH